MKKFAIAACLLFSSTAVAATDTATPDSAATMDTAAAQAFVELLGIGETFDGAIRDLKAQQSRQMRMMSMMSGGDSKEMVEGYSRKISELITNAFDKEAIVASYVEAYAAAFTGEELNTVMAFLTTPEGDKFLKQSDRIEMEVTQSLQPKMKELQESVQYLQEDMMATLKNNADPNSPMAKLQAMLQQKMTEQVAKAPQAAPAATDVPAATTQ